MICHEQSSIITCVMNFKLNYTEIQFNEKMQSILNILYEQKFSLVLIKLTNLKLIDISITFQEN